MYFKYYILCLHDIYVYMCVYVCISVRTYTHIHVAGICIKYIHLVVILVVCDIVRFGIASGHSIQ